MYANHEGIAVDVFNKKMQTLRTIHFHVQTLYHNHKTLFNPMKPFVSYLLRVSERKPEIFYSFKM